MATYWTAVRRSAIWMTWLAMATRMAGFAILLPLLLSSFSDAEVSVWLLFTAIAAFQAVVDFGFTPTFSREIAYGFAGRSMASHGTGTSIDAARAEGPDWSTIAIATSGMAWLYRRIALATFILLAIVGTAVSYGPVNRLESPEEGWIAWVAVVATVPFAIHANQYVAFLTGADEIALHKRWEALVSALTLPLQAAVLLLGGKLDELVVATQACLVVQVLVNRRLARQAGRGHLDRIKAARNPELLGALWPAAWRTASGTLLSIGLGQGLSIAMANVLVAAEAAAVQLGLRLIQLISQVSQPPFYTRIPYFNRLRAAGKGKELAQTAASSMQKSLWVFLVGAMTVDAFATPLLTLVGSQVHLPSDPFWSLIALAVLLERVGAMHVQLLLTGNRAIAHIANGSAAIVLVGALLHFFPSMGPMSLPVAMLVANGACYATIALWLSHAQLDGSAFAFEARTSLVPVTLMLALVAYRSLG